MIPAMMMEAIKTTIVLLTKFGHLGQLTLCASSV